MKEEVEQHRPRYWQIAEHYRKAIELGTLSPGQRLPSLRDLMRAHSVSLSTAIESCRYLESGGWIEARARSGYFVIGDPSQIRQAELGAPVVDSSSDLDIHSASTAEVLSMLRDYEVSADLAVATCAPQLYPATELRKLMMSVMRESECILASPAPALGNADFKRALARRALSRSINVTPEEIIVTHGASEGLALALRAVTKPGDAVLLESPTYYGALQLLDSLGVEAIELPTNTKFGLLPEAVEFALREHPRVAAVVNMPTLHNPMGSSMPNESRQRLVALCASHDIALIEDDVHADLHPGAAQLRAQKAWDRTGHVIYCSSLNKTLSPGLRLGWLLPGRWRGAIEAMQMSQSRPKEDLPQRVAARFLDSSSFERHLKRLHAALERQRADMIALIRETFPEHCEVQDVNAGLLLWVKLPNGVSSRQLFRKALENRIRILPGAIFSDSSYFDSYIRLSCGWPVTKERACAVAKLGWLCHQLASSN